MADSSAPATSDSEPTIIVVCGPPCGGKTTLSRHFQQHWLLRFYPRFEMDEIRLALWPQSNSGADRGNAYARMHELAAEAVRAGAPGAVVVATYQPAQHRRAVRVLADALAARLLVVQCTASADEAVARFEKRTGTHAATDLSAERVWDLAQDFPPFAPAIELDTSEEPGTPKAEKLDRQVEWVAHHVVSQGATAGLDDWVELGNPPAPGSGPSTDAGPLLTAVSRRRALRGRYLRWLALGVSAAAAAGAFAVLAKEMLAAGCRWFGAPDAFCDFVEQAGIDGDPVGWIQTWIAIAGVTAALEFFRESLVGSPRAILNASVAQAGSVPRMALTDAKPSNPEVYRRYARRLKTGQDARLLIKDLPLWFVVEPRSVGFDVRIRPAGPQPICRQTLVKNAARVGLDWTGYLAWKQDELKREYHDRYTERGIRALEVAEDREGVELTACEGRYLMHASTELSANLHVDGRFGFEFRQLLEGDEWMRSNRHARGQGIDLHDIRGASRTFEMLVGVQAALTTSDGILVLQRRSTKVRSASGGAGSSGAGSGQWSDLCGRRSLVRSVLREIKEEIGWVPADGDDVEAPFLGAAFNLLRGRDLNFYCHFHTRRSFAEVSEGARPKWLFPFLLPNVRRARDAWEVAHLIPVPIDAIADDGTLQPRFAALVGDARHVRGLIHCLARSNRFRQLRRELSA